MTCREFYLKFQYLIRLEDKGAPFGIQLVSHSLCMDLVTVGQAPCIIHFLFFFIFSTSIHIIYLLDLVSTLASKHDNDNQTEAIPADRMMIKRHPSPRLLQNHSKYSAAIIKFQNEPSGIGVPQILYFKNNFTFLF